MAFLFKKKTPEQKAKKQAQEWLNKIKNDNSGNYINRDYYYGTASSWNRKRKGKDIINRIKRIEAKLKKFDMNEWDKLKNEWKGISHDIGVNRNIYNYKF